MEEVVIYISVYFWELVYSAYDETIIILYLGMKGHVQYNRVPAIPCASWKHVDTQLMKDHLCPAHYSTLCIPSVFVAILLIS